MVGIINFQKMFGLCGLEHRMVEKRWGVTPVHVHGEWTDMECVDRARILRQNLHQVFLFFLDNKDGDDYDNEDDHDDDDMEMVMTVKMMTAKWVKMMKMTMIFGFRTGPGRAQR